MLKRAILSVLLLIELLAYSQELPVHTDSLVNTSWMRYTDSLNSITSLQWLNDSLTINAWADSMQRKVNAKLDLEQLTLTRKIDSLKQLDISTDRYTAKLDSLEQKKEGYINKIQQKQSELEQKAKSKLDAWRQKVTEKLKLDSLGIADKLPGNPNLSLDKIDLPGDLPQVDIPKIPSLNVDDFASLDLPADLASINSQLDFVTPEGLTQIQESIADVTGNMDQIKGYLKNPDLGIESAISQVDGVAELQEQLKATEGFDPKSGLEGELPVSTDPEEMKQQLARKAINHFEGKEEQLQEAMDKMLKYKEKFPSKQGLDKLPLIAPNSMKGRPFRERFSYGFNLNLQMPTDSVLLNLFPMAAYKISGRISAGLGGLYQLRLNTSNFEFNQSYPVWGLTSFTYFKTWKSFYLRYEVNANNEPIWNEEGTVSRDWSWNHYGGIQFNFKITNYIRGSSQYLYNFRYRLTDGFPEKSELRIGLEFALKPKKVRMSNDK